MFLFTPGVKSHLSKVPGQPGSYYLSYTRLSYSRCKCADESWGLALLHYTPSYTLTPLYTVPRVRGFRFVYDVIFFIMPFVLTNMTILVYILKFIFGINDLKKK